MCLHIYVFVIEWLCVCVCVCVCVFLCRYEDGEGGREQRTSRGAHRSTLNPKLWVLIRKPEPETEQTAPSCPGRGNTCTGVPHSSEAAPPQEPTVGLCRGLYGSPRGGGTVSDERGNPVGGDAKVSGR